MSAPAERQHLQGRGAGPRASAGGAFRAGPSLAQVRCPGDGREGSARRRRPVVWAPGLSPWGWGAISGACPHPG